MRALGRRLSGYRASAPFRATGGGFAVSPVDVARSLSPLPRQGQRIGQDRQRRRCCPQIGDNLWITQDPGRGSSSQASLGLPVERLRPIRWRRAGSSMEGTSGAADPALLRGSTGDAALGPGWRPRASGPLAQANHQGHTSPTLREGQDVGRDRERRLPGWFPVVRRLRHRSLQPMKQRSRDRRCPSGSGWGKSLAKREAPPVNTGWSLARETSAGDRPCSR